MPRPFDSPSIPTLFHEDTSHLFTRPKGYPRSVGIFNIVIEYGLYLLIVFTPFAFGTVEPWSIAIAEVLIFAIALAWGLKMATLGTLRIERTPLNLCWVLVLGYGLLQIVPLPIALIGVLSPKAHALYRDMAIDSGLTSSWRTLSLNPYATKQELLRLLALALVFWVSANHFQTREQVNRVVRFIVVVGFLLAVFGIVQHIAGNGKMYWVRQLRHGWGFAFGPYVNRNHFAGYIEMVIPLALGRVLVTKRDVSSHASGWRHRLLQWGTQEASRSLLIFFSGLIMVAALLLTGSKSGLLSFAGSMLVMVPLLLIRRSGSTKWRGLLVVFIALGFTSALWLNAEKVLGTFRLLSQGPEDSSARSRLLVWQDTFRLGRDYRWTGAGLNTFAWVFPLYKQPRLGQVFYSHPENDYLQAFAEGGLVFVAILALALVWGGAQFLRGWRQLHRSSELGLALGLLAALVAMLLHSAGDFNLHITANAILFVLLLGLAARVLIFGCSGERPR